MYYAVINTKRAWVEITSAQKPSISFGPDSILDQRRRGDRLTTSEHRLAEDLDTLIRAHTRRRGVDVLELHQIKVNRTLPDDRYGRFLLLYLGVGKEPPCTFVCRVGSTALVDTVYHQATVASRAPVEDEAGTLVLNR
jgi:hypothetical protein